MTKMLKQFQAGVNLGGWLSQYKTFDHRHFQSFITATDIEQIAGWGLDHVRLPIDYPVLESDDAPSSYLEQGFAYIDNCLTWCQDAGLGLVLDLHHAPGYSFTNTLEPETQHLNTLFHHESAQQRFINLWQAITRRYHSVREGLRFELLNEIVLPDSAPWNALAVHTIDAIRQIDPDRPIIIGGNNYNDVQELKNLVVVDDPHVHYTFHFYRPMLFTHQRAYWMPIGRQFTETVHYPGSVPNLGQFLQANPEFEESFGNQVEQEMNRELLRQELQPAVDFMAEHGRSLYCGEFGVIDQAPAASSVRWHADMLSLLRELGIGWALWAYKQMDFGLVDENGRVVNNELINLL